MSAAKPKIFHARLELLGNSLHWTVVRIPFDAKAAWPGMRGRRVRGALNGVEFRSSLMPVFEGGALVMVVNKQMQRTAKARLGDEVEIRMEPDMEERAPEIPAEFARILKSEPELRKWFQSTFTVALQREIGKLLNEPKTPASRQKRAEQVAERLMLTMEGEIETPPVLRIAFQREPLAARGWQAMTATQRRRHLLGIFHYRTPDGQQRRAQKVVEDAVAVAQRGKAAKNREEDL